MNTPSIRSHLILLVTAVSAPLVAVVAFSIYHEWQQTIDRTKTELRTLTNMMVSNTGGKIANARRILERVAARPQVMRLDPSQCDSILKDLRSLNLSYADVGYTDLQGQMVCSALLPMGMGRKLPDLGKTEWFQAFLQNRSFTIGRPYVGPVTGKWVTILSEPIRNERHEMIGGVQFSMDLSTFDPNIPAQYLPPESNFGFIGEDGTLIWRNRDPNKVIGTRPDSDAARRIVAVRNGEFEGLSGDGVKRFFSVVHMPETRWIAYVGVPVSAMYAEAWRRTLTTASVVLAIVVIMFALAIAISRRIADPVAGLEKVAHAVARGDLSVRAAERGPRDIAVVGREFNAMIDARLKSEVQLRIAATAFESQEGMMITDANRVILQANRAITEITGFSAEELIGSTSGMLRSGRHSDEFYDQMWSTVRRTGKWQGEVMGRRKNGQIYPKWLTLTAVKAQDGTITNFVIVETDITARKAVEEKIAMLAFYDPLTELPNRRLLRDRLLQAQASSARSGHSGALLFIDLDNFKSLNDTLGHDMGDMLLRQVAQRLTSCVREEDTVARLGGDEFVVMLEGLSEDTAHAATQAELLGEKILDTLNQPFKLDSHTIHSTLSIGITLFSGHQMPLENLLKQADLAMYQSKTAGRNTLRFFEPAMQAVVSDRAAMEVDLREAVRLQQFVLHYQPQVLADGRLTGAEALVRWQHPRRGTVAPFEFIPLAEECGLILPLGQWVLETACAQLAAWGRRPETAHLVMAVNVSASQLHQADFADRVLDALSRTGANPARLKLELTESVLVSQVESTIEKMVALKAHGVGFSLDDFGTGYSSLYYLKRLPLDQLKIDRDFVNDILVDPNDAAIAKMIVALADSLGLTVIAEGVEMQAQRDHLAGLGCGAYQGYLFGRPLPLEEFEQMMAEAV